VEGAQWGYSPQERGVRHDQWRRGLDVVWSVQKVKKDKRSIG
jgi:hypothetical protein